VFDLRYHVASLAAVFLALIIGILVGVGIASQTSVEESERQRLEFELAQARGQRDASRADVDLLRRQQTAAATYIERSYDVVMEGRLRGVRVALLFVGQADGDEGSGLHGDVNQTLEDASAPGLVRMKALLFPLDPNAVLGALEPDQPDGLTLEELGRRLGRELVQGGETPLWDALDEVIVEDSLGGASEEADAVVISHTARINHAPTARFVSGLYAGVAGTGVPAVGIERTNQRPSRIAIYRGGGLSTVDSVDTALGRVALAELLRGGAEGHYGLKSTAEDGSVPRIEPLPLAPLPGG
jgi:Copper transport outer membrane protein, MctB